MEAVWHHFTLVTAGKNLVTGSKNVHHHCLEVRGMVSHPYKTEGTFTVLYSLTFRQYMEKHKILMNGSKGTPN
jgi:hypothetical protein